MSENANPNGPESGDAGTEGEGVKVPANGPESDAKGEKGSALGEGGEKALTAERTARKAAEKELAEAKAEAARLRRSNAATKGTDLDFIRDEIRAEFNGERLKDKVQLAAARVLQDASDAVRFLDLDSLDSNDAAGIKAAVEKLAKDKPYLAADSSSKGWGDVGAGARPVTEPEPSTPVERMKRAYGRAK